MTLTDLPQLNACLNSCSTVFLLTGFVMIKKGRQIAHRNCMLAAFGTSTLFLISYLTYHYNVGHTRFLEPQWFKPYYLLLLLTHLVGAIAIVPLILSSLWLGLKGRLEKHKKVSRWTFPIWLYVSVTGVVIYLLLYRVFPQVR